jgi:hypothetical protein
MALFAAVGVVHYAVEGPNVVKPEDEEAAEKLTGSGRR